MRQVLTSTFTATVAPQAAAAANSRRAALRLENVGTMAVLWSLTADLAAGNGNVLLPGDDFQLARDLDDNIVGNQVYVMTEFGTCSLRITEIVELALAERLEGAES